MGAELEKTCRRRTRAEKCENEAEAVTYKATPNDISNIELGRLGTPGGSVSASTLASIPREPLLQRQIVACVMCSTAAGSMGKGPGLDEWVLFLPPLPSFSLTGSAPTTS